MISNKLLSIILSDESVARVPLAYQSIMLRAVEDAIANNEVEVIGHDIKLQTERDLPFK